MNVQETSNIIKRITEFLSTNNTPITEGSASPIELADLARLADHPNITSICEIGFNAGFSSYTFLSANKQATLTSFDLGEHASVPVVKKFIDQEFPARHTLVLGDSTQTIVEFAEETEQKFDLIFIDGGHSFDIALTDIKNCLELAHADTIVIVDDLVPWLPWGIGPYRAWNKAQRDKLVTETGRARDGRIFPRRTWAYGRYLAAQAKE